MSVHSKRTHRPRLSGLTMSNLSELSFYALKRLFDVAGALLLLTIFGPVMAFLSLLVRLESSGPAIFIQRRLTKGGRTFLMYKFRTMSTDAEARCGATWASDDDPRVTRIGKFLRRTRLDELPQLINVLIGDMSLIGPRPERPELLSKLEEEMPTFRRRMDVPGGITGLAQVSSGYASSVEEYREKLSFDLDYVKQKSLWLDIKIAFKTVWVVITGRGAR